MAVVTGADRTDIQLAALEASTQCLILTGIGEPLSQLIHRAEELEVPILKVELDTLSAVEIIEQAFGHVRIHESIKASYAVQLVQEHVNLNRILETINFPAIFQINANFKYRNNFILSRSLDLPTSEGVDTLAQELAKLQDNGKRRIAFLE